MVLIAMKRKSMETVSEIFNAALKAVSPYDAAIRYCRDISEQYKKCGLGKLIVIGFGKAACPMAKAIEKKLQVPVNAGIIITKYGHCRGNLIHLEVVEAGHPVPDENGLRGTETIINLLKDADEQTLVLSLISGGGSALLVSPCEGITLAEKQVVTDTLLRAGADIYELNTVRKHISRIKGGRLAELAYPAKVISLILSDVIGDRLDVIASGPTAPDTTSFGDAILVLDKYGLKDRIPANVLTLLNRGAGGVIPDTPKAGDKIFEHVENIVIGSNTIALSAAKEKAVQLGFQTDILSAEITGEAREVGKRLAEKTVELRTARHKKLCLISGGETTVTVRGKGKGGRNMEMALSFAMEIQGLDRITFLSAGTDGTDGPTDAAGAIVDGKTIEKAGGMEPEAYLKNNDSYHFFKKTGDLLITGPTGTNVMDIQIVVIE
jgi:glycerate 2-kinase